MLPHCGPSVLLSVAFGVQPTKAAGRNEMALDRDILVAASNIVFDRNHSTRGKEKCGA